MVSWIYRVFSDFLAKCFSGTDLLNRTWRHIEKEAPDEDNYFTNFWCADTRPNPGRAMLVTKERLALAALLDVLQH